LHETIDGRREAEIDRRADAESMTLRETVHHIVEANVGAEILLQQAGHAREHVEEARGGE
jgi:hypothetical protein